MNRARGRSAGFEELLEEEARMAWRGVKALEVELEQYGIPLRALCDQHMRELMECLADEEVQGSIYRAHSNAVREFARLQGHERLDLADDDEVELFGWAEPPSSQDESEEKT